MRAAVEYDEYAASMCPGGCGQPKAESFDPANEEKYEAKAVACHACAARARRAKNMADQENSVTDGVFWIVTRDDD